MSYISQAIYSAYVAMYVSYIATYMTLTVAYIQHICHIYVHIDSFHVGLLDWRTRRIFTCTPSDI